MNVRKYVALCLISGLVGLGIGLVTLSLYRAEIVEAIEFAEFVGTWTVTISDGRQIVFPQCPGNWGVVGTKYLVFEWTAREERTYYPDVWMTIGKGG